MKNTTLKLQALTPEQLTDERELMQFCHDSALRACQMLDREKAVAGLPDPYSPRPTQQRRVKKKSESVQSVQSVVKTGGVAK